MPPKIDAKTILAEMLRRETMALAMFQPLVTQLPFLTMPWVHEWWICGGNRSGKSLIAAVRFAAAALNYQLKDHMGNPIFDPLCEPKKKTLWCIGLGEEHIGQTLHRLLFEPGLFPIIQDERTGRMRAWNPFDEADKARKDERQESPPLIPPEEIDTRDGRPNYDNAGMNVWKHCPLKNGNHIWAFSSKKTVPKMGDPVDAIWIDERIQFSSHYWEWKMRLADRNGYMWWAAFPGQKNPALASLDKRTRDAQELAQAALAEDLPPPKENVFKINLTFSDNPYIEEDGKASVLEGMPDEERKARDFGEFAEDHILMYPDFSKEIHGIPDDPRPHDRISYHVNSKNGFQPGPDWTRYLIIDPGHSYQAALVFAVPPPEATYDGIVLLYDEVYVHRKSAKEFAFQIAQKLRNQYFEAFIIDGRAARQTYMGGAVGETIARRYQKAFEENGLTSRQTSSGFRYASPNIEAGCLAVNEWLAMRQDNPARTPTLRFVLQRTPKTVGEIMTYHKTITDITTLDRPATGQMDHAMDCLRYAAADGLPYIPPPEGANVPTSAAYQMFLQMGNQGGIESDTVICGAGAAV